MESYQDQVLAFLKGELSAEEKRRFEDTLARSGELRAELERSRELLELMEAASEQTTARRVENQIHQAIDRCASDIHLAPGVHETIVSIRIDGELKELERFPRELNQAAVDRWKLLADCSLTERQSPQEGRFLVSRDKKEFDLRVMILPTVLGERVTTRILSKKMDLIPLDRVGFSSPQLETVRTLLQSPSGFLSVAGRGGSGKTGTLYAMLVDIQQRNEGHANIMTAEDPVEFVLEGISQTRVNRRIGFGYAAALRSIYRSDPDIVLVGELPDRETAELALEMAATGHLVLAALPGKSAIDGIERLRGMGIDGVLIALVMVGGIGQRLMRRVCGACRAEYEPPAAGLRTLGLTPADGPFYRGRGCEACRSTGYKGRVALFEVFEMTAALSHLVAENAPAETVWQAAFGQKCGSLWHEARDRVRQGITTVEEALRVLFDYPRLSVRPSEP